MTTPTTEPHWSHGLFAMLSEHEVKLVAYVPDAGNAELVRQVERDRAARAILLTTEEEGVAFCAGADLVGRRAVLLLQSSGVGNCVNFLTLAKGARFPIFMIVTMRGEYGEANPWQYAMGEAVAPVLECMDVLPFVVRGRAELEGAARAALAAAFQGGRAAALILSQRFLGAKAL